MGYTGLVDWYVGVQGAAPSTTRRVYRVPAPPVPRLHATSAAPGRPGDGNATPSYGGLVGWYASVTIATERQEATPVARQSLPHAA